MSFHEPWIIFYGLTVRSSIKYHLNAYVTVLLLLFLSGCSSSPFYKNFVCSPAPDNAIRLEVSCVTDKPADVFVEYWSEHQGKHLYSGLSEHSTKHQFELIDLLPHEPYRLVVHGRIGDKSFENDAGTYTTDSLPGNLPSFTVLNNRFSFDGYVMIKTFIDSGAYILINDKAQVIWYQSYDSIQLRPFEWTKDKHIVSLKDRHTILEFDLHSNIYHQTEVNSGEERMIAHHEVLKNDQGNYVFLTKEIKRADLRSWGGIENDSIVGDGIVEMTPAGKIVWKWNIFDWVDPMAQKGFFKSKRDWGHGNSVAYARDGNFLVSFRDFSQIWKIDSKSGQVLWRFGKGGDFGLNPEDEFLRQHTAYINSYGDLMLFDNGTVRRGYSGVRSFKLDEKNKHCEPVISFKLLKEFFTARMGSAYLMDDRHVLVCSPMKYVLLGVFDEQGKEVWKVKGSSPSYRALYIDPAKIENARPF